MSVIDSLFGEFAGPEAVPICQIVHMEMMKMMMDDIDDIDDFDDEVAQTFFMHWEGRVTEICPSQRDECFKAPC